ncbi:phosphotransferase enzyme family protein [Streptacidiphilus carbonis]|uniref:phosphotransferase enzyme family protein n=1 Tax=Streptacidiphilus carbonis TaxID=105422 RepID=UPI0009FD1E15|nr:aminoglycoside phosphotransferase family protein [Streptacidiphilus carbonis]
MTEVESPAFDCQTAACILREACSAVDVDPNGIELVRLGDHAVFRLEGGDVIARVGRSPSRLPSVQTEVAVANWLAKSAFPSARLIPHSMQPVVVDGYPVTFWMSAGDGDTYASTREMGILLRRLHDLPAPSFPLPPLRPFDKAAKRLAQAQIPGETREFLEKRIAVLASEYDELHYALPLGTLHGDFNIGNVLLDSAGCPTVIDLDGFAIGPREWDLMQTAMYFDSFGWHTAEEYADFANGYGFDVRQWSGYPVLRSVRELLMVLWLIQNAGVDPRAANEVERRVESLRSGTSRRDWAPF